MSKLELKNHLLKENSPFKGKPQSPEHRQKIAASWDKKRRIKQGEITQRTNETENKKLRDYTCPDCGQEFEQVTRGVYGGHRKACLYWQKVEKWLEAEEGEILDEILEP